MASYFLAAPEAFGSRMATMVGVYRRCCEALGREPDEGLVAPVAAKLRPPEGG